MTISAKLVSELRKATGCGMMDCKNALTEAGGDMDKAAEGLRKKGIAKAAKKAARVASEGMVAVKVSEDAHHGSIIEINSETDFVAKDDNFSRFVETAVNAAFDNHANDLESCLGLDISGQSLDEVRQALIAKIGENVQIRRVASIQSDGIVGAYVHGNRIGVLVSLAEGDGDLARDIAMHIAAAKPMVVLPEELPQDLIEAEKEIYRAQALDSGKPEHIIDKMIEGRLKKYLDEVCLMGQPFVKNPDITIEQLLTEKKGRVTSFVRYELGEGIEKKQENFAEEVMAQIK